MVRVSTIRALAQKRVVGALIQARPGRILASYSLDQKPIASGASGVVFRATQKVSNLERAVKKCFKAKTSAADLQREMTLLKEMDHPHIVKLYETFEDKNCIYFVMELCKGGSLGDRISEAVFTEMQCVVIMQQILRALSHMHQMHVCHRDLKPENCLLLDSSSLEEAVVKLVDLGSASQVPPETYLNTMIGTPCYMAPQVIEGRYNACCDMWSCGVMTYLFLSTCYPFEGVDETELLKSIRAATLSGSIVLDYDWQQVSSEAIDFVTICLTFDSEQRASVVEALGHAWMLSKAPGGVVTSEEMQVAYGNCRRFSQSSQIDQLVLHSIARQLDGQASSDLRKVFASMDQDGDGQLTFTEFESGIKNTNFADHAASLMELMESLDTDGSGSIDYTEFLAAALDARTQVQEEVVWAAFHALDTNGDETISRDELLQVLADSDVQAVADISLSRDVDELMERADTSGDGVISFSEFMVAFTGKAPQRLTVDDTS